MTNGEMIQKVFNCEVCEPIIEDDIIHVIFADKKDSAIGFDLSWWNLEYKEPTAENDLSSELDKNSKKLEKDFGELDCISRAQTQTKIEMNASRYTIAKERGGMGQVEWSDQLIKVSDAVDIIRHLSSVTPQEPKTGQWVLLDECSNSGYYCSECHKKLVKEGWSNTVKKIKYCPNCGCYCGGDDMSMKAYEKMIDAIDFAIKATDSQDDYSMGMRNGMRYVKSLIDSKEPHYELRRTDEEIKLGIDLGDEVVGDYGSKGVVVGIDTYKGKVLLSLLTRNHKVPQLVEASRYKKTGRHFDAIEKLYEEMEKGGADGK